MDPPNTAPPKNVLPELVIPVLAPDSP